jgi:SP family arabinose:H+ symporter-like MFS transporter
MPHQTNHGFVYRITIVAAVGGLLFGYDTAVIAGAIGFLQVKFGLSPAMVGWVASCVLLGCIAGSTFAGKLSDMIGRRKVLMISALLFVISSIGTSVPSSLSLFIAFRVLGGVGIGIASILSPLYISEIAPAAIRGRLVSLNQLGIVSGILIIYFINAWIAGLYDEAWNVNTGWRWMFGSGLIPSLVFFLFLFFVPESPRWLAKMGKMKEAEDILVKINGPVIAAEEITAINKTLHTETPSFGEIFKPQLRKPMLIGIGLAVFSQVTGINAIMYYAPEIFKSTGEGSNAALMQTVLVGIVNLLFTLVAIRYVDKWGRKALLLTGSAGMSLCLLVIGTAFHFNYIAGPVILSFILLYIACFAMSLGPLAFVVVSEIFPNRSRGIAMSVCIFFLWIAVFLVSQSFPVLLDSIGSAATFWIFMVMGIAAFLFIWKAVPETKGKSLEEIERSFSQAPTL